MIPSEMTNIRMFPITIGRNCSRPWISMMSEPRGSPADRSASRRGSRSRGVGAGGRSRCGGRAAPRARCGRRGTGGRTRDERDPPITSSEQPRPERPPGFAFSDDVVDDDLLDQRRERGDAVPTIATPNAMIASRLCGFIPTGSAAGSNPDFSRLGRVGLAAAWPRRRSGGARGGRRASRRGPGRTRPPVRSPTTARSRRSAIAASAAARALSPPWWW